ncbi:tail fiber domain-containing protein [Sinorhizobium sp. BG8]|uniref:tail fiber domain-containing protein n=1 Tax=Sinorhizobium sp. BG8 TaxID=2613773 RepID=UPI00193DA4B1|nr:tail fiber domain-containing protein [Sinorhizobium sp. BG8]
MASTPKETTTKTEPWDGAKPYIEKYLKQADELYSAGKPEYYKGDTVADQSKATTDALKQQEAIARGGFGGIKTAQNTVSNITSGNKFSTQANNTLSQLQNGVSLGTNPAAATAAKIASGQNGTAPGTSTLTAGQNWTNAALGAQQAQSKALASGNNPAMDYLRSTASGAEVGNNPYLDQMVANQQTKIADQLKTVINPQIDSQAASLGRMGSGAYASQRNNAESTAANAMAQVATDMYGNQYNTDKDRQMSAAGQYGNFYNSDQQNQMQVNANLANTSAQQQGIRTDAANSLNNQYQFDKNLQMQGLALQNDIYQSGIQNQFQNGTQKLNAANSQFANQNAQAQTQLQGAGMAGDMYGLSYLPSQYLAQIGAQKDQRAQDVLNADIQRHDFNQNQPLANIANMINLANGGNYSNTTTPVYNNTGGQIAGGITSLLGLLSMCDQRTKIVFECVGKFPNGIPMYRFAYKDNPDEVFVGPLAQEVEAVMPDAVIEIGGIKHIINDTFMEAA